MFNMKRTTAVLAIFAVLPSFGFADTGQCPEMSGVLEAVQPQGTGAKVNQSKLIEEVGAASASSSATRGIANDLKKSLPGNQEAIVADLMISAYCEFLKTSQNDVALDESVQNYQKTLYDDVFANTDGVVTDDDRRPDNWLLTK